LAESLPQLLLVSDLPERPLWGRLVTAIHLGESVDIGAVLLAAWPHGATLTVAADGTATTDPTETAPGTAGGHGGRQLVVLDTDAAAAALAMLAEAHDDARITEPTRRRAEPDPTGDAVAAPTHPASSPAEPTVQSDGVGSCTPEPGRIRARILGEPAIFDVDGNPISVKRRKIFELLVYLGVNRDGNDRATMMETFWPDAHLKPAEASLNNLVTALRTALRSARPSIEEDTGGRNGSRRSDWDPVPNTGSRYHLDPACVELDWWTVLDEYTNAASARDDDTRLQHLLAAIAAISGPLADNQHYEWIDTDHEAVRRRVVKIYCHAAQLLTHREPDHARQLLDQACDMDPLNADVARRAMRAAAGLGDADAVRHRRQAYARALADSGLDIDDETDQLAATLLGQLNSRPDEP
jgi:DNA-binding SARP family transcriptional activator